MTILKKTVKPLNPLIFRTAGEFAAVWYEAGRSSGLTSVHKTPRSYARANFEKFVPMVIKYFLEMLKPTSNCSEHMRQEIYAALIDPVNDPNLVNLKEPLKNKTLPELDIEKIIKAYDKNQMKFNELSPNPKPTLKDSSILNKPMEFPNAKEERKPAHDFTKSG